MSDIRQRVPDKTQSSVPLPPRSSEPARRTAPPGQGGRPPVHFDQAPGSPGFMASPLTLLVVSAICLLLVSSFWPLIRAELDTLRVEWFEACRGIPLVGQSGVCEFLDGVARGKQSRW